MIIIQPDYSEELATIEDLLKVQDYAVKVNVITTSDVDNSVRFEVLLYDKGGPIAIGNIDILTAAIAIVRSRAGVPTTIVATGTLTKAAGRVYYDYTFATADWATDDSFSATMTGVKITVAGTVRYPPIAPWLGVLRDISGIEAKIDIVDANQDTPAQNSTANLLMRDPMGNKTDTAVTTVGTEASQIAYTKGIINKIGVPVESIAEDIAIIDAELDEGFLADRDNFDVADATGDNERWVAGYINGTEGGSADLNTTSSGKARIAVQPDATPTAAAYSIASKRALQTKGFRAITEVEVISFGTPAASWASMGMRVSPLVGYDTNNTVYIEKQSSSGGVGNRIAVGAVFGSVSQGETYLTNTDITTAFKVERNGNIWRCYYSLTVGVYNWVLLKEFEDTAGAMVTAQAIYLIAYSPGNAQTQTAVADFDNYKMFSNIYDINRAIDTHNTVITTLTGAKDDAAVETVGVIASIIAYLKGILNKLVRKRSREIKWSLVQPAVTIPAVAADLDFANVIVPSFLPAGATITGVYAIIKWRKQADTSGALNKIIGASKGIRVMKNGGAWGTNDIFAIDIPTDTLSTDASATEGGDIIIGAYDISSIVDADNATYLFRSEQTTRLDAIAVTGASLTLKDHMTGLLYTWT